MQFLLLRSWHEVIELVSMVMAGVDGRWSALKILAGVD
jgi:hypothetical protein